MTAALCAMLTLSLSAQNNTDKEVRKGERVERKDSHGNHKCKGEMKELSAEKMATHRANSLREELNLTDKQYEQVYALCLEQAEEMKAHREAAAKDDKSEKVDKADRPSKEAFDKKREANDKKMKAILTDEQFAKYKELRAKDHRGPRKHGPGHDRPNRDKAAKVSE